MNGRLFEVGPDQAETTFTCAFYGLAERPLSCRSDDAEGLQLADGSSSRASI